jgi:hypothetical protein
MKKQVSKTLTAKIAQSLRRQQYLYAEHLTPEVVRPYPKAGERKTKNKGKKSLYLNKHTCLKRLGRKTKENR